MKKGKPTILLLLLCLLLGPPVPLQAQEQASGRLAEPNNDDEVVYIDPAGFIRVYDQTGAPVIAWVSPEGGWSGAALGDFTGEGDQEIVAIGEENGVGRLAIYDPVVASGVVDSDQQINGIPWRRLYFSTLPARPRLVAVGEFDSSVAGQEIIYTADAPSDGGDPRSSITILTQSANPADGSAWRTLTTTTTGQQWSDIATGDLEVSGIDDLVLIDEDRGVLAAYRLRDGGLQRYFLRASDSREWSSAAIGQVDPATAQPELVLVRRADRPLASLVVLRYEPPDNFADVYLRDFNPSPRVVFLADVSGSGDSEIFMLRNVVRSAGCPPPYNTTPFQLIMRNRGPDRPTAFEVCLDQANTFRYGVGGDLDGDGKDEVIVLSSTQLRIFSNIATTFAATNVPVSSNARTILAGNLDKAGAVKPNTLLATPQQLVFDVSAGGQSTTQQVQISNSAPAGAPIPLAVHLATQTDDVRWSLSSDQTPAVLSVYVDAAELLPKITYGAELVVEAVGVSAINAPYRIPILIRVGEGLVVRPAGLNVVLAPCAAPVQPLTVDLRVLGSSGLTFAAEVAPGPAQKAETAVALEPAAVTAEWPVNGVGWISSAQSPTTTVPSTITLTLDVAQAGVLNQAHVTVTGQYGAETFVRNANVSFACADYPVYLPFAARLLWPR